MFLQTLDFFAEVRKSITETLAGNYRPVPRKPEWWLTHHAEAWEQLTDKKLKSACPFFWGAMRYLVYTVIKNLRVTQELFASVAWFFSYLAIYTALYKLLVFDLWLTALLFSAAFSAFLVVLRLGTIIVMEVIKASRKPAKPAVAKADKAPLALWMLDESPEKEVAAKKPKPHSPPSRASTRWFYTKLWFSDRLSDLGNFLFGIIEFIFERYTGVKDTVCPPME